MCFHSHPCLFLQQSRNTQWHKRNTAVEQTRRRLSKRQRFYFVIVFIVAFIVSIASVTQWNQLYSSDLEIFSILLFFSLFASVASNVVANKLTISHISKVGFQG